MTTARTSGTRVPRAIGWALLLCGLVRTGAAQIPSPPVYNTANGHWYQAVRVPGGISWPAARAAAEARVHAGYRGHLVTVTSAEEHRFILQQVLPAVGVGTQLWLGGYQDPAARDYLEPAGGWRWITGEPWSFANWNGGEPNNGASGEDSLHIGDGGHWNDRIFSFTLEGYLVEYDSFGGPGDTGGNLLINGSFEAPAAGASWTRLRDGQLPGWRITRGDVDVTGSGTWPAAPGHGFQSLDLAGGSPGTIEQSFLTVPGREYLLSGWMSHNPENPLGPEGRAIVSLNGQPITTLHHWDPNTSLRDMRWVPFAHRFRAFSTVTTLAIADVSRLICCTGLALDGLSVTAVSPNLLVNGSFEEPRIVRGIDITFVSGRHHLPGWRITRGSVDVVPDWQPAPDGGTQSLDLVGVSAGGIEQTFSTLPGGEYLLEGWIAHNTDGLVEGRAQVFLNGQPFVPLVHHDPNARRTDMRWARFAYRFQATASATTLTILDTTNVYDGGGLFLDGLSVTAVGDPSHIGLLGAPTGLSVRLVAATQVELSWFDGSSDETSFEVYRREGGGAWTWVATLAAGATRFADFGLRPGTTYAYQVRARNDRGVSAWSNEAVVTTLPGP